MAEALPTPIGVGDITGSTQVTLTGTVSATAASSALVGTGTAFLTEVPAGAAITFNGESHNVSAVASNTALTLATNAVATVVTTTATTDGDLLAVNTSANGDALTLTNNGYLGLGTATPNSQLQLTGPVSFKYLLVLGAASPYTTVGDSFMGAQSADGAITINLATADTVVGRYVTVKDTSNNAGANNITIATEGAELIDGAATAVISTNNEALRFICDGTNWFTV